MDPLETLKEEIIESYRRTRLDDVAAEIAENIRQNYRSNCTYLTQHESLMRDIGLLVNRPTPLHSIPMLTDKAERLYEALERSGYFVDSEEPTECK